MQQLKTRVVGTVLASGSLLCLVATVAAGVKWR